MFARTGGFEGLLLRYSPVYLLVPVWHESARVTFCTYLSSFTFVVRGACCDYGQVVFSFVYLLCKESVVLYNDSVVWVRSSFYAVFAGLRGGRRSGSGSREKEMYSRRRSHPLDVVPLTSQP